jgi:hypothetical protein
VSNALSRLATYETAGFNSEALTRTGMASQSQPSPCETFSAFAAKSSGIAPVCSGSASHEARRHRSSLRRSGPPILYQVRAPTASIRRPSMSWGEDRVSTCPDAASMRTNCWRTRPSLLQYADMTKTSGRDGERARLPHHGRSQPVFDQAETRFASTGDRLAADAGDARARRASAARARRALIRGLLRQLGFFLVAFAGLGGAAAHGFELEGDLAVLEDDLDVAA